MRASARKVWDGFKALMTFLDAFLLILSPLVIILFVVLVIVLLDNFGTHWRFLQRMEREGVTAWGVMGESYDPADDSEVYLAIHYPAASKPDEIGLLRMVYYPEAELLQLHEGDVVEIRYLPDQSDVTVMLEETFDPPRNFLQLNQVNLMILAVSWLILAWHPEFLYLGFITNYGKLRGWGKDPEI